jgi:flagellin FlaB
MEMRKKMERRYMEKFIGKYCKIVTRELGQTKASVVSGIIEDIDYKDGFIMIDSHQGLGCLRIDTILAIKPGSKRKIDGAQKKTLENDDKGMVGIGTLIVFIAMILIAAVAASVLIKTSETLQSRARTVGTATIREVSAGLAIEDITGYTNANKTTIEYLALTVRPRAGSKDIDLSLCTMSVLYDNLTILTLNESLVQNVNLDDTSVFQTPVSPGSNYTVMGNLTLHKFGVIAIHDPDDSVTATFGMNSGDRIILLINLSAILADDSGLPPRETVSGTLTPEIGIQAQYDTTSPAVYSKRIIALS